MPAGRPRAYSRRTIEDAANELFLEQGYAATSLDQIAQRAGVARATLFGYVGAKSDLLWLDVDDGLDRLAAELGAGTPLRVALHRVAAEFDGTRVPLAVTQAELMGAADELRDSGLVRFARLESLIRAADPARGLAARVRHRALAGAVSAAWEAWALAGIGRAPLARFMEDALDALAAGVRLG